MLLRLPRNSSPLEVAAQEGLARDHNMSQMHATRKTCYAALLDVPGLAWPQRQPQPRLT